MRQSGVRSWEVTLQEGVITVRVNCTQQPQPFKENGKPHDGQRADGTYTSHDFGPRENMPFGPQYMGLDVRHQFEGDFVDCHIWFCSRCGRDKAVPVRR